MVTDDERREVAERLRGLELGVIGTLIPTGELAENILRAIDYGRSGAMTPYGCLADLIDPDCEEGRYEGVHTARPVDRDALLALADEMSMDGMDGLLIPMSEYARRIREALGVVA